MRIAAKRLRYVLEIVGPCFGPEADAARDAARRLQSVLGEIHDCDVMLPRAWGIESLRGACASAASASSANSSTSGARRPRPGPPSNAPSGRRA